MQEESTQANIASQVIYAAGGARAVQDKLRTGAGTPYYWMKTGRIPRKHVLPLCRLTGGAFQPNQVRPDAFDADVRV